MNKPTAKELLRKRLEDISNGNAVGNCYPLIIKAMEEHAQNEVERYKKRWSLAHKALLISMECFKGQATALMPMYELYKARDKAITEYNALLKDDQDEKKMKPKRILDTPKPYND